MKIKPDFKVLSINDYFHQFLELNKSLPNFTPTGTGTSEGLPKELIEFLSSEAESLVKFSAHIENEKAKLTEFYQNLKQQVLNVIEDKMNEAVTALVSQLQLLKSNFNELNHQIEVFFNGKFPETFSSLDEVIAKANKFTSESGVCYLHPIFECSN